MRNQVRFEENSNIQLGLVLILSLLLAVGLEVFVHEFSHFVVAKIFDWTVIDVNISFSGGFIKVFIPENDQDSWKELLMLISGSTGTFLFGVFLLFLGFKSPNLRPIYHYMILIISMTFIFEILCYFFADFVLSFGGDWYSAFELFPPIIMLYYFIIILHLYYSYHYYEKYFGRILASEEAEAGTLK